MPEEYFIQLEPANRIRANIRTERGRLTAFTEQLETEVDGEWRPVTRYDTAHGRPHRDVLDIDGRVTRKIWMAADIDLTTALQLAEQDLRRNANRYCAAWRAKLEQE